MALSEGGWNNFVIFILASYKIHKKCVSHLTFFIVTFILTLNRMDVQNVIVILLML